MILCDLCNQVKQCLQKEIDGKEFDLCADCWRPLEEKLKGKGRTKKRREIVFLPPRAVPETQVPKAPPGLPPKIFGAAERRISGAVPVMAREECIQWTAIKDF